MNFNKKIIISALFVWLFLAPALVLAQSDAGAQPIDPAQEAAKNAAQNINVKLQVPLPFVPTGPRSDDPTTLGCDSDAVCSLKDYLEGVYRLLIGAGAMFAVVMMIVAGYQWMFAGGGERAAAAKKRLFGAGIGLLLALLSYVILQAISNRLVEFKLPDVPEIKPFFTELGGQRCDEVVVPDEKDKTKTRPIGFRRQTSKGIVETLINTPEETECGFKYQVYPTDTQSADSIAECGGIKCSGDNKCLNTPGGSACKPVFLYGNIAWGITAGDLTLGANSYVDKLTLLSVCFMKRDTTIYAYQNSKENTAVSRQTSYEFVNADLDIPMEQIIADCESAGDRVWKGFYLKVEVNDDTTLAPTADDDFVIGKDCTKPIIIPSPTPNPYWDPYRMHASVVDSNLLFQPADFIKGVRCDLRITRSVFPAR